MRLIKKYCQRGMMVMCTIHQPRAAIWNLFEKVRVVSMSHACRETDTQGWRKGKGATHPPLLNNLPPLAPSISTPTPTPTNLR